MAEEEGFEPSRPFGPAVFKTAAINHSATPPEGYENIIVRCREIWHIKRGTLFMTELHPDIESVVLSESDIKTIVGNLGAEISRDYAGLDPIIVCVLRGAFVYTADLLRAITCPCTVDFMVISSYGSDVKSSGHVRIRKDLDQDIRGRHVIIAEDILDTGLTLHRLKNLLQTREPASIKVAAFSVKDIPGYQAPVTADYVGCHVPNKFIVGYGLDYDEHYRNVPYIGVLKPEVYEK